MEVEPLAQPIKVETAGVRRRRLSGLGVAFADAERADNNLSLLRLAAAFAVLFAHSWPVVEGAGAQDPVTRALSAALDQPVALSGLAVHAFFVISGYLVTKSALTRRSPLQFAAARVLRIYPALLVHVLIVALFIGPLITGIPVAQYFLDARFSEFVANNALMWNATYELPGVFEERLSKAVNASLWTLPVEIRCYLAIGFLLAAGLLRSWTVAALLVVLGGLSMFAPELRALGEANAASNIFYFMFGALVFLFREKVPANGVFSLGLLLAGAAAFRAGSGPLLVGAGLGLSVLWAGLIAPKLFDSARWLGDPSYGVYLWAYPIQQIVVETTHVVDPWAVTAIAGVLTLAAGVLSWRLVERRALAKADSAALWASRGVGYVGRIVGARLTR